MSICVVAWLSPASAHAQPPAYPSISGAIPIEIENDWTYNSDDRANHNNDLYATIEPEVTVQFSPHWSIFAHAVLEPVTDPEKFENRVFEDHGLYLEDLSLQFDNGPFGARAGKLNVGFGIGWDKTPGVYGTDFAEDGYETSERIGIIGSFAAKSASAGTHKLSAGSFFADTTIFSQSTLRGRGDTRKRDGGVSNTESFESFIVALDGENMPGLGKLGYHAAFMHQAKGSGDVDDENSFAFALFTTIDLGQGVSFSPLIEFVHQENAGGASDERDFLTLAGQVEWNGFNIAIAWTGRDTNNTTDDDDFQAQLSVGYAFKMGLSLDIGWKIAEEAGINTETVGALAAYTIEF
jgi:hypothetical protein